MIPVGFSPMRLRPRTTVWRSVPPTKAKLPPSCWAFDDGLGGDHRLTVGERRRLRDRRHLADAHGEIAVRQRDGGDLHVAADHHGAGALVDDDARHLVRRDPELADLGDEARAGDVRRPLQVDRAKILLLGDGRAPALAGVVVDDVDDADGGLEVGIDQRHRQLAVVVEAAGHFALHQGAVRHPPGRRHALRQLLALAGSGEAGDGERPLRDGVDLAVGAVERRHDERAAHQRARVAERGDGDVHARARLDEGRQFRRDRHRGDVAAARCLRADVDAHAVEHRLHRLLGERRVAHGIAGALQADDEAVADELVRPRAVDVDDVLDADGAARRLRIARCIGDRLARPVRDEVGGADRRGDRQRRQQRECQAQLHPDTLTVPSSPTMPDTMTPLSALRTWTVSPALAERSATPRPVMNRPPSW